MMVHEEPDAYILAFDAVVESVEASARAMKGHIRCSFLQETRTIKSQTTEPQKKLMLDTRGSYHFMKLLKAVMRALIEVDQPLTAQHHCPHIDPEEHTAPHLQQKSQCRQNLGKINNRM